MRHRTVSAVLFAGALAFVLWLTLDRSPSRARQDFVEPNENPVVERPSIPTDIVDTTADSGSRVEGAAAELRNASQTFRNSTLLIAIRRSGFYCDEVVAAHESTDGLWVASCVNTLGYAVSVREIDEFDVRPIAQYFDSLAPLPQLRDDQLRLNRDAPIERLEPEPLRR